MSAPRGRRSSIAMGSTFMTLQPPEKPKEIDIEGVGVVTSTTPTGPSMPQRSSIRTSVEGGGSGTRRKSRTSMRLPWEEEVIEEVIDDEEYEEIEIEDDIEEEEYEEEFEDEEIVEETVHDESVNFKDEILKFIFRTDKPPQLPKSGDRTKSILDINFKFNIDAEIAADYEEELLKDAEQSEDTKKTEATEKSLSATKPSEFDHGHGHDHDHHHDDSDEDDDEDEEDDEDDEEEEEDEVDLEDVAEAIGYVCSIEKPVEKGIITAEQALQLRNLKLKKMKKILAHFEDCDDTGAKINWNKLKKIAGFHDEEQEKPKEKAPAPPAGTPAPKKKYALVLEDFGDDDDDNDDAGDGNEGAQDVTESSFIPSEDDLDDDDHESLGSGYSLNAHDSDCHSSVTYPDDGGEQEADDSLISSVHGRDFLNANAKTMKELKKTVGGD